MHEELNAIVAELWLREDPKTRAKLWGKAQVALMRAGVNGTKIATIVNTNDVEALKAMVEALPAEPAGDGFPSAADGRTIGQARAEAAAADGKDSLDNENLKRALKAFRRKLKTIRRDDESKLGAKYVTMGKASKISAVEPPRDYPPAVWAELVRLGRLRKAGQGTYELPE